MTPPAGSPSAAATPGDHFSSTQLPGSGGDTVGTQDRQGMFLGMSWLCELEPGGPDLSL